MLALVINPGSTSTKVAVYDDMTEIAAETIRHSLEELSAFDKVMEQLDFRKDLVLGFLEKNNIKPESLKCIMSRGGSPPDVGSGATLVNDELVTALIERPLDGNPASLGPVIADSIAKEAGIPAYIYDPITTDELSPLAKMFGVKGIEHQSMGHVLNTRAMGIAVSEELGKKFEESDFIVVHIGGGNSVTLWNHGRLTDTVPTDAGTFSAERCGFIRTGHAVSLCKEYGIDTVKKWLSGKGGFVSLTGTNELAKVEEKIEAGDADALKAEQAMAYQLSRSVCSLLPMVHGKLDGIVFTGGGAYWKRLMNDVKGWIEFLDIPVFIRPGENEMQALANGAYRVMTGREQAREYGGLTT